jgi:hypothetical protein
MPSDGLHGLLGRLDDVDWAALRHAYGPATDVPARLRGLLSADRATRQEALRELCDSVDHGGMRWQASAPTAAFLLELAAAPAVPDRPEIVRLLAYLAIGYDSSWLPDGVLIGRLRAAVAQASGRARRLGGWVLDTYDAVRAGVPLLCALLEDGSATLRRMSAYALAWFPEERTRSLPALRGLFEREHDPGVMAAAMVAAGLVAGRDDDADLVGPMAARLGAREPVVRLAAALALARLRRDEPPGAVVGELLCWTVLRAPPGTGASAFPFWDPRWYAYRSLARLGGAARARVVQGLLHGLGRVRGPAAFHLVAALLDAAFPDGVVAAGTRPEELTATQRRVVHALERQRPWRMGQAGSIEGLLAAHGLLDLFQATPVSTLLSSLRRLSLGGR